MSRNKSARCLLIVHELLHHPFWADACELTCLWFRTRRRCRDARRLEWFRTVSCSPLSPFLRIGGRWGTVEKIRPRIMTRSNLPAYTPKNSRMHPASDALFIFLFENILLALSWLRWAFPWLRFLARCKKPKSATNRSPRSLKSRDNARYWFSWQKERKKETRLNSSIKLKTIHQHMYYIKSSGLRTIFYFFHLVTQWWKARTRTRFPYSQSHSAIIFKPPYFSRKKKYICCWIAISAFVGLVSFAVS